MIKQKIIMLSLITACCLSFSACSKENDDKTPAKEEIKVSKEVTKIGPYSQMIRSNGFVYCSAQVAFDPETGKLIDGDIAKQTEQIFKNYESELKDAGLTLNDAVKATVYIKDMSMFKDMNAEYQKHFKEPYPVRTCVEVSDLPVENALVSIEVVFADKK